MVVEPYEAAGAALVGPSISAADAAVLDAFLLSFLLCWVSSVGPNLRISSCRSLNGGCSFFLVGCRIGGGATLERRPELLSWCPWAPRRRS